MDRERPENSQRNTPPFRGRQFAPEPADLNVRFENILSAMDMDRSEADDYLTGLVHELIEECKTLSNPCARYSLFSGPRFDPEHHQMQLDDVSFNLNKVVASLLKHSDYIAVFVATCGENVGRLSAELNAQNHMLESYVVDLIGSELAEEIASAVHQQIEKDARKSGLRVTNRYSPGYSHWHVSEQQKLFSLMDEHPCGIRLTDSSLMVPIKSVSGIIGVGEHVEKVGYGRHIRRGKSRSPRTGNKG